MPSLIRTGKAIKARLNKDLVREIKRGHAWLFSDALQSFACEPGTVVHVYDRKGDRQIASGIGDPGHPIAVRVCRTNPSFSLDEDWVQGQLENAIHLRRAAFGDSTTGFRLIAGEGDGLPGFIADVYGRSAVLKFDGGAPESFYRPREIGAWLKQRLSLESVVLRTRQRGRAGECIAGSAASEPVEFHENGMRFTADIYQGQKTGFFLDQRDNRELVRRIANGKSVLNLFSFNGGFSVAAGLGGASEVTSVDIASPAIEAANTHWAMNDLNTAQHEGVVQDCFEYLEQQNQTHRKWDIVICDPPSFAPNEKSRDAAVAAYDRLARASAKVTRAGGILALASCSSHIDHRNFVAINSEALGRARRRATLLADRGLPIDHPTPLAMPELRYLKFLLFQLD